MLRYPRYRTRSIPKVARRLPIRGSSDRGDGMDDGRYFRCWHCGFICDSLRDVVGGSTDRSGDYPIDYVRGSLGCQEADDPARSQESTLGAPFGRFAALECGPDGEAKAIRHSQMTTSIRGCPSCGNINYKG